MQIAAINMSFVGIVEMLKANAPGTRRRRIKD